MTYHLHYGLLYPEYVCLQCRKGYRFTIFIPLSTSTPHTDLLINMCPLNYIYPRFCCQSYTTSIPCITITASRVPPPNAVQFSHFCPTRLPLPGLPWLPAPQRPWHMEHGAGGDCFAAIRGLLVVKSTAGTVHIVGCACVLYADVCEVHLCRTCVRTPPSPDHLLFVTREDRSRLAHRDLGCRWLGNGGFDAIKVCRRCWTGLTEENRRRVEAIQRDGGGQA